MRDQANRAFFDRGLGEGRDNGVPEALQPIHKGDQDVLATPDAQLVHDREQELSTLVIGDSEAKNVAIANAGGATAM